MRRIIVLACLLYASSAAAATTYTYRDLYTLSMPAGFSSITPERVGVGGQIAGEATNTSNGHAMVWGSTSGTFSDLNPTGFDSSYAFSTDGIQQVGIGHGASTGGVNNALLWTGTASSVVDLNPVGFASSALGVGGGQQVGYSAVGGGNIDNATLWNGTASSAVNLNPVGFTISGATGTNGSRQVGYGWGSATGGQTHALLWSGTASSKIDLNPVGFTGSIASAISGNQEVGHAYASPTNLDHAMLWRGTSSSAVDLHPLGFTSSDAMGTNSIQQVGYADKHAMIWTGTASSAIDLNSSLSAQFLTSEATSIDANGNVFGWASDSAGKYHAIEWLPTPEPTSISALACGVLTLLRRRRSCPVF